MKCLKNKKTGNIVRVSDTQVNQMGGNMWKYISKSELKKQKGKTDKNVNIENEVKVTSKEEKRKN